MSSEVNVDGNDPSVQHELSQLRKDWWWLLLLGCVLVVGGIVALSFPLATSVGVTVAIGTVLLICGFATIISAFWTGKWSGFLLQLLIGILYVVLGMSINESPLTSVMMLTMLAACLLIVAGMFRVVAALVLKFPQWGWTLLNGVVTTLLGVVIFRHFPETGLWLVGTLVGVDLIFNGWSWIMLAINVRNIPELEQPSTES